MLKLTKKVEYAMQALLTLDHLPPGKTMTVKALVHQAKLPQALMGKILQSLNRAGIVISIQGVNGGYKLNRALADITMNDLIEAVDGPIGIVDCLGIDAECDSISSCNLRTPFARIQADITHYFLNISMARVREMEMESRQLHTLTTTGDSLASTGV
jgi:Rrf2 family protein